MFHDVGKGMPIENHVQGSLHAIEAVLDRLALERADCEAVRFLIGNHLAMSATVLRRDIFDPDTVRQFAEVVGTSERLKMLCLFTYADIRAVNPEALTPWKAEMLWQLYVAASNVLTRNFDDERFYAAGSDLAARAHPRVRPRPRGGAAARRVSRRLSEALRRDAIAGGDCRALPDGSAPG